MRTGRNILAHGDESAVSLDHWDMRTGRNEHIIDEQGVDSLDHWDMRTGRNWLFIHSQAALSLDHWDMRTGRNLFTDAIFYFQKSRSLGYAHWPELVAVEKEFFSQSRVC